MYHNALGQIDHIRQLGYISYVPQLEALMLPNAKCYIPTTLSSHL